MPLTSTAISGRRSFGGANIEIEVKSLFPLPPRTGTSRQKVKTERKPHKQKLNDPTSHQAPPPSTSNSNKGDGKSSKSSLKKKQKELPISGRRTDLNNGQKRRDTIDTTPQQQQKKKRRVSSEQQEEEEEEEDAKMDMNTKWEGGEDQVSLTGFKKPSGFEGAKKLTGGTSSSKKGGGGGGKKGLMDLDQHKWGKKGETREWDREKPTKEEYELGSEEDDQRILDGLDEDDEDSEDSEESEDDEEEIRKMLMSAKALDRRRATAGSGLGSTPNKKKEKEMIEKELARSEGKSLGEGISKKRKDKGKSVKVRR
jgi:hypothetical protein